jgi:hypothetical protein
MKGKRASSAWKKADVEHKQRQEELSKPKVWRYYLPNGQDGKITFLDGNLNADGTLAVTMIKEHNLNINGNYKNWYACTDHGGEGSEPCPICEGGDKPYVAGLFTIIDHSKYVDKNGKKRGNEVRLFVAKREALNILQKRATQKGGLAGITFEVSRSGSQSPNVGNMFDPIKKNPVKKVIQAFKPKIIELAKEGMFDKKNLCLAYEEIIPFYTAEQLRKRGFGGKDPVGSEDDDELPFDEDDVEVESGELEELL